MILPEMAISTDTNELPTGKAFWLSSATAALIASLKAVEASGKWVAVPPNVCPNVIAAIYGAGCKPWFVDIEPERQGIDPQRLAEVISKVSAVIAVHAYGVPCKIDQIAEVARKASVPLIEDCAQADGAMYMGSPVGVFGDIAVFSFGTGKIVDAGGGGLAIVKACWHDAMHDVICDWPESTDNAVGQDLGSIYRLFYNRFYPDRMTLAQDSFMALVQKLAPLFKTKCDQKRIPYLIDLRSRLDIIVRERRLKYSNYINQLAETKHLKSIPLLDGASPWRFNVLVDESKRDTLFKGLLADGIKVSTWYSRASTFLPQHEFRETSLPVSEKFEKALLNLWIDEIATNEDIEYTCKKIRQELAS